MGTVVDIIVTVIALAAGGYLGFYFGEKYGNRTGGDTEKKRLFMLYRLYRKSFLRELALNVPDPEEDAGESDVTIVTPEKKKGPGIEISPVVIELKSLPFAHYDKLACTSEMGASNYLAFLRDDEGREFAERVSEPIHSASFTVTRQGKVIHHNQASGRRPQIHSLTARKPAPANEDATHEAGNGADNGPGSQANDLSSQDDQSATS